ncbi:hypothetical protein MRX96_043932 [Rhipicephalus microplus]
MGSLPGSQCHVDVFAPPAGPIVCRRWLAQTSTGTAHADCRGRAPCEHATNPMNTAEAPLRVHVQCRCLVELLRAPGSMKSPNPGVLNPVAPDVCHPGDHARGQEASQSRTHYVLLLRQQPVITKRPEKMRPRAIANWLTPAEEKKYPASEQQRGSGKTLVPDLRRQDGDSLLRCNNKLWNEGRH